MHYRSGFTLIELVIVIILLGVLAATAVPRFIGRDSFAPQTYRDQLQQLLKTVQIQAMSCDASCRGSRHANPNACNKVVITATRFGIPSNCGRDLPDSFATPQLGMSRSEAAQIDLKFSAMTVAFDNLGVATCTKPSAGATQGCDISISSQGSAANKVRIAIEAQGFIHDK